MKHAGDNEEKKITASKIEKDELYLYSLRKMAVLFCYLRSAMHFLKLIANRKEEPLTFIIKAMVIIHLSVMME